MIDYLEDLLAEEPGLDWKEAALPLAAGREEGLWEEEAAPGRAEQEENGEEGQNVPLSVGWEEGPAAVRSGAATLLRLLTQGTRAVEGLRQRGNPMTVTLVEGSSRAEHLDLETLDRAVQRDARRYDGGFFLY